MQRMAETKNEGIGVGCGGSDGGHTLALPAEAEAGSAGEQPAEE